jgi:hypothetical protein
MARDESATDAARGGGRKAAASRGSGAMASWWRWRCWWRGRKAPGERGGGWRRRR